MEFRILGPIEVCGDSGEPIGLSQRMHRRLLAELLLHAGQPRSRGQIIEALWGDEPPTGPGTALRSCVHGLRKALGEHGDRLQTHPAGYLLRVIAGECDLPKFRALAGQGRTALDRGEPAKAAGLLTSALDLWRDPPLADLPPTADKARLLDQHRDAQDALMDARLALGHHHDALAQLRGIVDADPLREHAWAQLMIALYRSGARADALAAFRTIRCLLSDAHGIDPGPELRELHGQILNDDPLLAIPARPPARQADGPRAPVCQLPAALPDFTGRGEEIMALLRRLPGRGMAVTVISGMPGVGKTALGVHVAHLASPYFPDGQLYAQLGDCEFPRDPQQLLGELLRGLGVPQDRVPPAGAEREALYRSLLAGRKVLVIADGASSSAQVRPLLPGTAGSAVLVTSRSRLADLDGAVTVQLGEMPQADAVSMLAAIAGSARAAAEPCAARTIVRACANLPLALRVAGARLAGQPGLTLGELAGPLGDDQRRLSELVIGDQSVRARIASSERAVGERGRRALALLARHIQADAPAWLIPVLCGDPPDADVGAQLAEVGLLSPLHGFGATAVYRLHPLVRAYAAGLPDPDPARPGAMARWIGEAWLELADRADQQLPRVPYLPAPARLPAARVPADVAALITADGPGWLGRHAGQLAEAVGLACADGRYQEAAELAARLVTYQCQQSCHADADWQWAQIANAASQAGDALAAARARYQLAAVAVTARGSAPHAARILDGCLPVFRIAGDQRFAGAALALRAYCAEADGDLDRALHSAEQSLDAARLLEDRLLTCTSLSTLGLVLARLGHAESSVACCREALTIAAEMAEPSYAAAARRALSSAQLAAGRQLDAGRPGHVEAARSTAAVGTGGVSTGAAARPAARSRALPTGRPGGPLARPEAQPAV